MHVRALLPLLLWAPVSAAAVHHVELRVVPPQSVRAIAVRGGEAVRSVEVRNGKATIPADLPLPWSLGMVRFEADPFTREHLDGKRPWVIRELGIVRGRLEHRAAGQKERFTWLLARSGSGSVEEIDVAPGEDGAFELRVAAGTYDGVLLGATSATRIRSGIVVRPGEPTDLGGVVPEPAVPISLRVVDAGG